MKTIFFLICIINISITTVVADRQSDIIKVLQGKVDSNSNSDIKLKKYLQSKKYVDIPNKYIRKAVNGACVLLCNRSSCLKPNFLNQCEKYCPKKSVKKCLSAKNHSDYRTPVLEKTTMMRNATKLAQSVKGFNRNGGRSDGNLIYFDRLNDSKTKLVAMSAIDKANRTLYIAFKGTTNLQDVSYDLQIGLTTFLYLALEQYVPSKKDWSKIGMIGSFAEVKKTLSNYINHIMKIADGNYDKVVFAGHSLGGAYAQIAKSCTTHKHTYVYTFNAPGMGFFIKEKYNKNVHHIIANGDIVSMFGLPLSGNMYYVGDYMQPQLAHKIDHLVRQLKL